MVEARFESESPPEIVVALIYNAVRATWGEGNETPISQLPRTVIDMQPELRFQATRRWTRNSQYLNAGPHAITVGTTAFESGRSLITLARDTFQPLEGIFGRITRLGLRYVNLFEGENVFARAELKVGLRGMELGKDPTIVRAEINKGAYVCGLQVLNPVTAQQGGAKKTGSIIDIDVSTKPTTVVAPSVAPIVGHLTDMHALAEEAFFSVLSDEYIATLNPEYE